MRISISTTRRGYLGTHRVAVTVGVGDDELFDRRPADVAVEAMVAMVEDMNDEINSQAGPNAMIDMCTIPTLKLLAETAVEAVAGADYDVAYVCLKLLDAEEEIMVFADNKES